MTQIPIYRAKKIDSDEWVEGFYIEEQKLYYMKILKIPKVNGKEIDPSTLSIHFPQIVDKNGKKIFASLSEDGIGGSDVTAYLPNDFKTKREYTAKLSKFGEFNIFGSLENIEVTGTHKDKK